MTRWVSTDFIGALPRQVARGGQILRSWFANAFGDTSLVYDRVTGENGATPIDHSGAPNGCSLGMSIAAQEMRADLEIINSDEDTYVIAVPFYVSAGEAKRRWLVEVDMSPLQSDEHVTCDIRDSSWTVERTVRMGTLSSNEQPEAYRDLFSCYVEPLDEGWHYLTVLRTLYVGDVTSPILNGWRMRPLGLPGAGVGGGIAMPVASGNGSVFDAHASLTPSSYVDLYDGELQVSSGAPTDNMPLNSYRLSRLIRNQNSLWEWLTAARIPGNEAFQSSTIRLSDRATFTSEAVIDMPLFSLALGGLLVTPTGKTPSNRLTSWHRYPTTQTGTLSIAKTRCTMPTTAAGKMRARVLTQKYNPGTMSNWEFRVTNSTTGTSSSWAALTQLGSSDYWIADITDAKFVATAGGALNTMVLETRNIAGGAPITDEMTVGGWAMSIEGR